MLRGGGYDKTLFSYAPSIGGTSMQQNFIFFPSLCSSYEGGGREVARLKATTRVKQTLTHSTNDWSFFLPNKEPKPAFFKCRGASREIQIFKMSPTEQLDQGSQVLLIFWLQSSPSGWAAMVQFLQQLRPSKEYRYNSSNSGPGDLKNGSHLPAPRFNNNCSGFFRPDAPDRAFNRR